MPPIDPRLARLLARATFAVCAATIAAVLFIEHVLGYPPCKLCYQQRVPFYVALALSAALSFVPSSSPRFARAGLWALAGIFAVGAGMALNHVGVEHSWWPGPTDCSGAMAPLPGKVTDFAASLGGVRVASCDAPALFVLGLSLTSWNLVLSTLCALALGGLAWRSCRSSRRVEEGLGSAERASGSLG